MANTPEHVDRRFILGSLAGVAGTAAFAHVAKAGPLNPPSGSVAPSGRTLDDVYNKIPTPIGGGAGDGRIPIPGGNSTVTLTQPGSYVLTGDIVVPSNARGIRVQPDNDGGLYSIDLNGYSIRSSSNTGQGISVSQVFQRYAVRVANGLIDGFTTGISVQPIVSAELDNLVFMYNSSVGIAAGARTISITRCQCVYCPIGIDFTGLAGVVSHCVVSNASSAGVRVSASGDGLLLRRNTVINCGKGFDLASDPRVIYRDNTFVSCPVSVSFTPGAAGPPSNAGGNFSA